MAACPALSTQTQPSVCSAASGSPSTTTQVCAMIWFVHAACVLQQNSAQLSSSNMSAQRAIPETTPDSRARLVFDAPPQTKMPRNKRLQRNSNVQTKHSAKKHLLLRSCSGKHSNTPLPLQHKKIAHFVTSNSAHNTRHVARKCSCSSDSCAGPGQACKRVKIKSNLNASDASCCQTIPIKSRFRI